MAARKEAEEVVETFWDKTCASVVNEHIAYGNGFCVVSGIEQSPRNKDRGPAGMIKVSSDWFRVGQSKGKEPETNEEFDGDSSDDEEGNIIKLVGSRKGHGNVQMERQELLRKRVAFLCRDCQCNPSIVANPAGVLDMAVSMAKDMALHNQRKNTLKTRCQGESDNLVKLQHLEAKLHTSLRNEPDKLLEKKKDLLDKVLCKKEATIEALQTLEYQLDILAKQNVPATLEELCSFVNKNLLLERFCTGLSETNLLPWVEERATTVTTSSLNPNPTAPRKSPGNQDESLSFLEEAAEESLAVLATELERRGYPLSKHEVLEMAGEMVQPEDRSTFIQQSGSWILNWEQRMKIKGYKMDEILTRGHNKGQAKWFSDENISWWFEKIKRRMHELGVVDERTSNSSDEIQWKWPGRVLISQEIEILGEPTYLSSRATRKYKEYEQQRNSISSVPLGSRKRLSALMGCNLLFEAHPPVWATQSEDEENTAQVRDRLKSGSTNLGPINGVEFMEPFVTAAPSAWAGSQDLWVDQVVRMIKKVYPDVSNRDPSKKVVWFTNGPTKVIFKLAKACRNTGIHVVSTLPCHGTTTGSPFGLFFRTLERHLYNMVQQMHFGTHRTLSGSQKAEIATSSLRKVNRYELFKKGCARVGLRPFSREAFLQDRAAAKQQGRNRSCGAPTYNGAKSTVSGCSFPFSDIESVYSFCTGDDDESVLLSNQQSLVKNVNMSTSTENKRASCKLPANSKEILVRLQRLQQRTSSFRAQLETFQQVGSKTYEARVSVSEFESSLKLMAAEQDANRKFEEQVREAERSRQASLEKARKDHRECVKIAESKKHLYETLMRRELAVLDAMVNRLPSTDDLQKVSDVEIERGYAILVATTEKYLYTQKSKKRDPETGEQLEEQENCTSGNNQDSNPPESLRPRKSFHFTKPSRVLELTKPSSGSPLSKEGSMSWRSNPNSGIGNEKRQENDRSYTNLERSFGSNHSQADKSLLRSFSERTVCSVEVETLEAMGSF